MIVFVGQRIQWKQDDKHGWYINVHQNVAIDELQEIAFDKHLKDDTPLTPQMHTAYRIPHWLSILKVCIQGIIANH